MLKLCGLLAALLVVVPAFADPDGGDTETAQSTLTVDIQSAVTVSVTSPFGQIVLDENEVETGDNSPAGVSTTATVAVRTNDEATFRVLSGNLAPSDGESTDGPSVPPGTIASGTPADDGPLYYNLTFTPANDNAAWGTNANQIQDYSSISATAGINVAQGSSTTGTLRASVWTNSLHWEDAIAGGYSALVTIQLTAKPGD